MKALQKLLLGILLVTGSSAFSVSVPRPLLREVQIGINDAYVPSGFDSRSDVYVVTSGLFPNGCYRWSRADVKHVDDFNHEVRALAAVNQGMCMMVLIPFTKEVRLGKLVPGTHTLRFLGGDGTYIEKTLSIEK